MASITCKYEQIPFMPEVEATVAWSVVEWLLIDGSISRNGWFEVDGGKGSGCRLSKRLITYPRNKHVISFVAIRYVDRRSYMSVRYL